MAEQGPSPVLFFDTINAYQRTEALRAAIELGLFTRIAAGERTRPVHADRRRRTHGGADCRRLSGVAARHSHSGQLPHDPRLPAQRR